MNDTVPARHPASRWSGWLVLALTLVLLVVSVVLWQRLTRIQEQLARQTQDAGQQSMEAKAWAAGFGILIYFYYIYGKPYP